MKHLLAYCACAVLLLCPTLSLAQVPVLEATKLFATSAGDERVALGYDPATNRLYTASTNPPELRAYELDGTLVLGPLLLPAVGQGDDVGLHFLRGDADIGGAVPAGTLVFLQAGLGNDPQDLNESTLYALDKTTAAVMSSQEMAANFFTPLPDDCRVLKDKAKGVAYSTRRAIFVSLDVPCEVIGEIDSGVVTGFIDVPQGVVGTSQGGGIAVHPLRGTIWIGGAIGGGNRLVEFSEGGEFLQQFEIIDADTQATVFLRRLAFDTNGDRLFLLTFGADVYEIAGLPVLIPGLGPWGYVALVLGLGLVATYLGRVRRVTRGLA